MANLVLLVASLFLLGCATGHCRGSQRAPTAATDKHVWVYMREGSKQCEPGSGIKIEKVAESLGDIHVYNRETKSDGKMHMTLCGAATGRVHVFEISESDQAAAVAAGFKLLETPVDAKAESAVNSKADSKKKK